MGTSASAAASVTNTWTYTIPSSSPYITQFTEYDNSSGSQVTLLWQVSVSGTISITGGENQASSWTSTIRYSATANPTGQNPDPTDSNYVNFSTSSNNSPATAVIDSSGLVLAGVLEGSGIVTGDNGVISFNGDLSSDQTQITPGFINIVDPHWATEIQIPVTLISVPTLFTTGDDTVDFAGTSTSLGLTFPPGLTSAQVQAINAGAGLYNAMGGNDTVILPTSLDGTTYKLVPQSTATPINPAIVWDPSQTFVVGSAADDITTHDYIYAGTTSAPTEGSYKIQVNGLATATITIDDYAGNDQNIINAINNTITLGAGNDTVYLYGDGNSTVTAGSGNYTINISSPDGGNDKLVAGPGNGSLYIGGATLAVSSPFSGSATIAANSTLELQDAASGDFITFDGNNATLEINSTKMPTQTITGFAPGDTITLSGLPLAIAATVLKDNNMLAVYTTDGKEYDLQLDPTRNFSGGFQISGPEDITLLPNNNGNPGSTAPVTGYAKNIYPYNCIRTILVPINANPNYVYQGTGFIIGPHTILTAAHVVAGVPTDGVLRSPNTLAIVSSLNPIIAAEGPYHISSASPSGTHAAYAQNDFAVITVKQDLGPQAFSIPALQAPFAGGTVNATGYPVSVPGYGTLSPDTQFNDIGTVSPDSNYAALDSSSLNPNDLVEYGGESGGPLWTMSGLPGSTATAWGIVSNGPTNNTAGYDVQLTPTDYIDILAWEAAGRISLGIFTANDFTGSGTSDALFYNNLTGNTWFEAMSNGAFAGWNQIGGSNTYYSVAGVGDFYGSGTDDILFRNNSTGDTWFEAMSNGAFAGWNQIGGSDTHYAVVGVGDFLGNGTNDILFRNNSTGDTWVETISNGAFASWNQIGGSNTNYAAVGIGDFFGSGTDDILFRNNSTGDTWFEAISNGASAGWNQIGGSNTYYSVAGVGDFYGSGTDDILFRNNLTGDTWIEAISNGAFAGWQQIGGSNTNYSVVGVGDYFGNGTSDILFLNNSTGDTWFEAISNGGSASWNQIGGSNTSYSVPITV